jgi:hypothetical protein
MTHFDHVAFSTNQPLFRNPITTMDSADHLDDDVTEPMPAEDLHNPQAEDDYGAVDQGLIAGSMVGMDTESSIPEQD